MKKIALYKLGVILIAACLYGCADIATESVDPTNLGISKQKWDTYSLLQKQHVIHGSAQVKGPLTLPDNTPYSHLEVRIKGGQALMPPFTAYYSYVPLHFSIESGRCETIALHQDGGDKSINLEACYINNALYLDPSLYKVPFQYGVRLVVSPVWSRGFTYRKVNTYGYARLRQVDITVHKIRDYVN